MPDNVAILRPDRAVPVFHLCGEYRRTEEPADVSVLPGAVRHIGRWHAVCGLPLTRTSWLILRNGQQAHDHWSELRCTWLRREHAERFARLCARCGAASR